MIWCLHGAVGMADDWKGLARAWSAAGETVRRVDLWRFLACDPLGLEEVAAALNAEARQTGESERNVLIGYSMGGRLALHALLEDPQLWSAAVIVSAHPGLTEEGERMMRMARDAEWAGKALTAEWSRFLAEWNGQAVLAGLEKEGEEGEFSLVPRESLETRRREVAKGFMEWSLGKQENLRERLPDISGPVLWLTGEEDGKFQALAEESISLLPQGSHLVVPEAGHRVPWDAPEFFLEIVGRFLGDQENR